MDAEDRKNIQPTAEGLAVTSRGKSGSDRKADGIHLTVITPEEEFYDGVAESVILRTVEGYMGFLRGRTPACVLLHDEGSLQFRKPGGKEFVQAFLKGGFAFMDEDMTIYTDQASWPVTDEELHSSDLAAVTNALEAGAQAAKQAAESRAAREGAAGTRKLQHDTEPKD